MYSTAKADVANMSAATSTWQYIGTPYRDVTNARNHYYDSWLYKYSDGGWVAIPNGGAMEPFRGYCVTHPSAPLVYDMHGTLAPTTSQDIAVLAGYTVIANSWVAPIDITTFTDDDMENISDKTIYFFNTGTDAAGTAGTGTAPGTYVAVPKNSASYVGTWQIPSMQGFYISTTSAGTLHLDYDRHVRPADDRTIVSNPMYAPRRAKAAEEEPAFNVMDIDFTAEELQDNAASLSEYLASQEPSLKNSYTGIFEGKNLILICAESYCDAFILPELTPTLWRLSHNGIYFSDFCGERAVVSLKIG
jgi:hypothetical protein